MYIQNINARDALRPDLPIFWRIGQLGFTVKSKFEGSLISYRQRQ